MIELECSVESLHAPNCSRSYNTGVTTEQALLDKENSIHPDLYTDQLSDLLAVKEALTPA